MKSRTHQVIVTLTFNKKIGRAAAVRAAKNSIHGKIYATICEEVRDGWSTGRIGSVKSKPKE